MYIDFDRLLAVTKLSQSERFVVEKLMEGYSIVDLYESYGGTRQAYGGYYRRAVQKIIREYNDQWAYWHGELPANENPQYCL